MTSSTTVFAGLARPLPDLAAWTTHFRRAEIPVLREIAPGHQVACHFPEEKKLI